MSQELESLVRRADLLALDDQLEELFGDDLSPRLLRLVIDKKEGRMPDTTPTPESPGTKSKSPIRDRQVDPRPAGSTIQPPPRGLRPWVPALAAAVAVVAIGVGAFVFLGGDEPPPVATDAEALMNQAIETAEQYVEALNSYDAERVRALVADDQINMGVFLDLAELADIDKIDAALRVQEIVGFQYSPYQCDLSFRPAVVQTDTLLWVLCDYQMDSRLQQVVGHPPIPSQFGIGVADGVITRVDEQFPFEEWAPNVDQPFIDWLNANHPGGFESLYVATTAMQYPRLTEDALELLATYVDQYEASVTGG